MNTNLLQKLSVEDLDRKGFLVLEDVLSQGELSLYSSLYEDFISGKLDASNHRHDLGSHVKILDPTKAKENITQIMWPSLYLDQTPINSLEQSPLHQKAEKMAKTLLGEDMAFDFDMLISKVLFISPGFVRKMLMQKRFST